MDSQSMGETADDLLLARSSLLSRVPLLRQISPGRI